MDQLAGITSCPSFNVKTPVRYRPEGRRKSVKWTREMIEAVRDEYRAKAKAIDSIEKTN